MVIADNLRTEQGKIKVEADELVRKRTDGFLNEQEAAAKDKGYDAGFREGLICAVIAIVILWWIIGNFKSTNNPPNTSQVGTTVSEAN